MLPHRAVEREAVHEQDRKTPASHLDRQHRAAGLDPEDVAAARSTAPGARPQQPGDLLRDGRRPPNAVDAHEHELGFADEHAITDPRRHMLQGEAGRAAVGDERLHAQYVAGIRAGAVFDDRLAHRGPDAGSAEDVHARSARQRLPAGALEQRQERRFVQMPEGVAFVGVYRAIDGRKRGHGTANVCQNTMRRNPRAARGATAANALAPYVGSSATPCAAASCRADSPAAVGCP